MSTAAEQIVTHTPGMTFDVDDKWTTPCACGRAFTSTTPSKAQQRQRQHAQAEAGKSGKQVPAETPAQPRVRECGCGCGQPLRSRAAGLFLSGHDARFKSVLARAKTEGAQARHPQSGEQQDPMRIAAWLDERRGGGDFWQTKVSAGLAPKAEPKPRPAKKATDPAADNLGAARAERVMQMLANRRAVPGDEGTVILPKDGDTGTVTTRAGKTYGARVVRRENEDAIQVQFLDGPSRGEKIIVANHRFSKKKR